MLDWLSDVGARVVLAVSVLLGGAEVGAQQQNAPSQPATQEQSAADAERIKALRDLTSAANKAVEVFACDQACQDRKKADDKAKEDRETADLTAQRDMAEWAGYLVGLTAVQLVLGAVTLAFLWCNLIEARKTTRAAMRSSAASRASVREARRAADAALKTVAVAEDTAKNQLRAYMSLGPSQIVYDSSSQRIAVSIIQENCGQTPARSVNVLAGLKRAPHPIPADFRFPDHPRPQGVNVVHPRHKFETWETLGAPITEAEMLEMAELESPRIYYYGILYYEDIYERPRETFVCWSYPNKQLARLLTKAQPFDAMVEYIEGENRAT